jgi:hypothetical protein
MGIKIFNSLPLELKSVVHFKAFKRKLNGYLLKSVLYSLQEFFCKQSRLTISFWTVMDDFCFYTVMCCMWFYVYFV